ncbi:hypothetical protein [Candidatus Nucleicultrix amoebiphila]|jgi:hypothetical protein|uniref:Uncharacterized protein n=1 Tax=Candidatus Nucleicultrix amoebiphila FS5 TaxID=1414854 RepID=A0A1W6N2Q0_9PROT|nr:hypothetical protein [Candidatus Nucleicultrix amoebiphila]ARN84103.1 hypothetical protein GQ61_00690 [Candidatus Nucleicultrix amoebiphila FS5]
MKYSLKSITLSILMATTALSSSHASRDDFEVDARPSKARSVGKELLVQGAGLLFVAGTAATVAYSQPYIRDTLDQDGLRYNLDAQNHLGFVTALAPLVSEVVFTSGKNIVSNGFRPASLVNSLLDSAIEVGCIATAYTYIMGQKVVSSTFDMSGATSEQELMLDLTTSVAIGHTFAQPVIAIKNGMFKGISNFASWCFSPKKTEQKTVSYVAPEENLDEDLGESDTTTPIVDSNPTLVDGQILDMDLQEEVDSSKDSLKDTSPLVITGDEGSSSTPTFVLEEVGEVDLQIMGGTLSKKGFRARVDAKKKKHQVGEGPMIVKSEREFLDAVELQKKRSENQTIDLDLTRKAELVQLGLVNSDTDLIQ